MSASSGPPAFSPSPTQLRDVAARHGLGGVRGWRPLTGGWANPVLLLECERTSAVLKINTRYLNTPNVATEAGALAIASSALAASGAAFRVPAVIGADTGRTLLPFDYLLVAHLPGANGGEVCKNADDATRRDLSRQLGETTWRLHGIPVPGERYGGWDPDRNAFGTDDDWRHLIARRTETLLAGASATEIIPGETLTAIGRWLDVHLDAVPRRPARVLVHNDPTPWNTLVEPLAAARRDGEGGQDADRWRITGIFDFEWSIAGPPAHELEGQLTGPGRLIEPGAFLDGYAGGARLGKDVLSETLYYRMLHQLSTVVQFSRHWRHWGDRWIQERVGRAQSLLRGEPPGAFTAAGYGWPF